MLSKIKNKKYYAIANVAFVTSAEKNIFQFYYNNFYYKNTKHILNKQQAKKKQWQFVK